MPHYPPQSLILPMTVIKRDRRLPPNAVPDSSARENTRVASEDVLLRGYLPSDFLILDALKPLGLKKPADITEMMIVTPVGGSVQAGDIILSNGSGRRAKTLKAPLNALFARLEGSDVILQTNPEPVEVRAMIPGDFKSVRNNGTSALVETVGALIQCAWGNGKPAFTTIKMEPKNGINSLAGETLLPEYRSFAMILQKPILSADIFKIAHEQQMSGLIAPSMHANLREIALQQTIPVILTEGFGESQMSEIVYNLLRDYVGQQALLDAVEPTRWSSDRPEIVVQLSSGGSIPPAPITNQSLTPGLQVRITRAPLAGITGKVQRVVEVPRAVESGLRLIGADVLLSTGRTVFIPLANLETLGRPPEQN